MWLGFPRPAAVATAFLESTRAEDRTAVTFLDLHGY
jgi:hypothetical protein